MMLRRLLDWLVGRKEPREERIREYERRMEILDARLHIRRRQ